MFIFLAEVFFETSCGHMMRLLFELYSKYPDECYPDPANAGSKLGLLQEPCKYPIKFGLVEDLARR